MAEEHHHHTSACGTHEHEGGYEIKDRGMFDFLGKKEEEKPQEEVIVAQFEKVQVSEEPCEKKEELKEEKPCLPEKLHRSTSSSSSVWKNHPIYSFFLIFSFVFKIFIFFVLAYRIFFFFRTQKIFIDDQ